MPAAAHALEKIEPYLLDRGCLFTIVCVCGWVGRPCYSKESAMLRHEAHVAVMAAKEAKQ